MTKFTACLVAIAVVACARLGLAEQLTPVTEFSLRDYTMDGVADQIGSGPYGIFGFVQEGYDLVDETFIEFDLGLLKPGYNVTLEIEMINSWDALTFDVSTYFGSGVPALSPFGTGDYLSRLSLPLYPYVRNPTYSLDVSSQIAAAIASGHSFLGVRLHDPAGIPPGSDNVPFVQYEGGSARLVWSTPEPSTFVLLGIGAISLLAYAWRQRRTKRGSPITARVSRPRDRVFFEPANYG